MPSVIRDMPTTQGRDGSVKPQLEVSNTSGGTNGEQTERVSATPAKRVDRETDFESCSILSAKTRTPIGVVRRLQPADICVRLVWSVPIIMSQFTA